MSQAVFCSCVPPNESLLKLFPLDFLNAQGIAAEFWDLSPLFGDAPAAASPSRPFVRRFADWRSLRAVLLAPAAREYFVVTDIPFEPRFFRLHRLLGRSRARLASVISGVLPLPEESAPRLLKRGARQLLSPGKLSHILLKRAQRSLRRLGAVRGPGVVFAAGSAARVEAGRARVVPINHFDYDEWLETRDSDQRLVDGRYGVYLDQFAVGHPDYRFLGIKKLIDPVHYYSLLNGFFKRLELDKGVEIVIAAHPRSDYAANPFGGRRLLRGATRALVRHCEFALTTYSTALGYAVLDRKPLIFFTTDDIAKRYRSLRLDEFPAHFARVLGRPCVNLDRPPRDELRVGPVDEARYDDYKHRYLVSPESEGRPSRDAFRDFFLREFAAARRA